MGGIGSGAPRYRRIAEECCRLDIRDLRRRGYLKAAWRFTWGWNWGGEPAGSIGVETEPGAVTLRYQIVSGDEPVPVIERIVLRTRSCHFGGHRGYFTCPRCWRSAEVLYQAGGYFRCRRCARVGYAIENLEKQWRADGRYRELETRLNADGSKPARMRWTTYHRLCDRLAAYDERSWSGIERLFKRLGRKIGNTNGA